MLLDCEAVAVDPLIGGSSRPVLLVIGGVHTPVPIAIGGNDPPSMELQPADPMV